MVEELIEFITMMFIVVVIGSICAALNLCQMIGGAASYGMLPRPQQARY